MAVTKLGDALAQGGSTFATDNDPDLIKAAAPFSLKLMESLLAEQPNHKGLLFAASSGFAQYAFAFVQQEADELEEENLAKATALKLRARKLYLRARDYGLRGLENNHPSFERTLRTDPKHAAQLTRKSDVPLLYWTSVAWAAAISVSKDTPDLIADLPQVEAMIDRALQLHESYDHGAIHAFFISYEMIRLEGTETEKAAGARKHFQRAMQLSGGFQAGPLVSMAESISIPQQNRTEFKSLLERALAIDPDAKPKWRLANLIMQRRARWLLSREDVLFL